MYLYVDISIFIIKGLKIFSILLLESHRSLHVNLEGNRLFCFSDICGCDVLRVVLAYHAEAKIQSCFDWPRSFLGTNVLRR